MTVLTKDAVTEKLNGLLEAKGEGYVYPMGGSGCFYAEPGGAPSCIVGHVIAALDPDLFKDVANAEGFQGESYSAKEVFTDGFELPPTDDWTLEERENFEHGYGPRRKGETESTVLTMALQAAQEVQDGGGTWGEAVEAYNLILERGVRNLYSPQYRQVLTEVTGIPHAPGRL